MFNMGKDAIKAAGANWTDIQGLKALNQQSKTQKEAVKKEVARQFEAMLVQTMLKSMREANTAFEGGLFGSEQQEMYTDLYDKQLSLVLSQSGFGLAKTIETWLDRQNPEAAAEKPATITEARRAPLLANRPIEAPATEKTEEKSAKSSTFDSAVDFVKTLWEPAKKAATLLGTDPRLLLAQAALETNWGKSIIPHAEGKSSFNLFNIKAGSQWKKETAAVNTLEQHGDTLVREKAHFRAYDSWEASFNDFVHLLQNNPRYQTALNAAPSPEKFTKALQDARYATDSQYADKIMGIYSSKTFNNLFEMANLA
ncbi:muramidase, peptidoglycan hydrolase FlgJ [Legionella geestiana]|uniref:Peptidoglycan hydrolase FlgJ n=2 Tax=Legionella geestiana TaxID=45065 RepID=A0A0W0U2G8_9GAMM|nr:flagellar assembly peptidoglycan hydrolase FlgJ [Legionella geestiana]KTD02072.1 muramidase, peptidoglycan hydrolase FlgJ [Legionella geestiana]QBS11869.1 flagellar assembly peptidoglycan hydrolase FlgJ [Legionella geestiana]QDQ40519.1 flagellar assembly peptidoglycan hydrolase FlgJ [Legionella geestiana]STX53431.1 muramidase, peptidoglycan hydrolase FlgJ [Legionella geestiana]